MTAGARLGRRIAGTLRPGAPPFGLARKALLLAGISLAMTAFGASAATASARQYGFQASAYGTKAMVGSTVTSGRSAAVVLGCTSNPGITNTNTAASVNVPSVLSTGTIDTSAASKTTATGIASTGSARTHNVSLLGGVIKATAIKSVSTTNLNTSTGAFRVSPAGTEFVGLVVNGTPMSETPPANDKITLPGIGYVVLNQQSSHVGTKSAGMTVVGIHLVVTATATKPETQVFVSSATSSLTGPVTGLLNGLAFGTSANVGSTIIAGKSFPEYMPCVGTNGVTKTNSGASVSIPSVLSTGTITDTADGTVNSTQVSGEMASTIQNLNLLGGTVTATAVKADVTANGNPPTLVDNSSFVDLNVAGSPIADNVPANTKINLPDIGTLWLNRLIKTASNIKVVAIQLVVTDSGNPEGLPVGATIDVGYARVGVS